MAVWLGNKDTGEHVTSLSSVRVILTCSPSGHSEERDEREEMILHELNLSALMAATPSEATSDPY